MQREGMQLSRKLLKNRKSSVLTISRSPEETLVIAVYELDAGTTTKAIIEHIACTKTKKKKSEKELSQTTAAKRKTELAQKSPKSAKTSVFGRTLLMKKKRGTPAHKKKLVSRRKARKTNYVKVKDKKNASIEPFANRAECEGLYKMECGTELIEKVTVRHKFEKDCAVSVSRYQL